MGSPMAVTKLFVVSTPSLNASITACQSDGGANHTSYIVGGDWAMGQKSDLEVYLCARRERVAAITDPLTTVLQRVRVFEDTSDCPTTWTLLYSPRDRVTVCTKFAPASNVVLSSFNYVTDVDVGHERFYSDASVGWTTAPISAHVGDVPSGSEYSGAFLTVRHPIEPITRLQVLRTNSGETISVNACEDQLGSDWAQVETSDPNAIAAICFSRAPGNESSVASIALTNVTVQDAAASCSDTGLALNADTMMCAEWSSLASAQADRVADLLLVSSVEPDATDATQAATTSGFIELTSSPIQLSKDTNATTHVFARFVRKPTYTDAPQDAAARAKPPLSATLQKNTLRFRILQIADLHFSGQPDFRCRDPPAGMNASQCTESIMSKFVDDLLDLEEPDLVVFTGDNVNVGPPEYRVAAIEALTRSVEARGIPFTLVLGNHDDEGGFPREQILEAAMAKTHCYAQHGPLNVPGVGNYALNIHAPASGTWGEVGTPVLRLYFLDSHGYPDKSQFPTTHSRYAWIQPSQLDYYRSLAAANTAHTPSLMFFHIPIPEYTTTYFAMGEGTEAPCPSSVNSHLLSTLVDIGDVKATFVGHDHANQYCALRDGVQLCYGGGAGFGVAYGRSTFSRRARVIEWSVDNLTQHTIQTWSRFHGDLSGKHHEQTLHGELSRTNITLTNPDMTEKKSSMVPVIVGSCAAAAIIVGALVATFWWKTKRKARGTKTSVGPFTRSSKAADPRNVKLQKLTS